MYTKSMVQDLARGAIASMLEGHVEMMKDVEDGRVVEIYGVPAVSRAIGDLTETIREITLEYIDDMMSDMKFDLINEIKQMKFTAKIESTLKFHDAEK